jgi:formylglycine-generating enzyme required for sulfatase activity
MRLMTRLLVSAVALSALIASLLASPLAAQAAPSGEDAVRASEESRPSDSPSDTAFVVTIPGTEVTIEMVRVPPGMVGESSFWIARTETTWDAYDAFVYRLDSPQGATDEALDAVARPSNPYMLADHGFGREGYPVIAVSAKGAAAFCEWLGAHTGRDFRLPTEAEWESVCCAGGGCDDEDAAETPDGPAPQVWTKENAKKSTHPVAEGAPDALGLRNMRGNVTEWCTAADGSPVAKGGCFLDEAEDVTCTTRRVPTPEWNARDPQIPKSPWWLSDASFTGFRVVCEDGPSTGR